jgi:phage gpG-like protein
MFSIAFNSDALTKKWRLIADESQDLDEVLKAFGAYLRKKAKDKFAQEGPGWPRLAESTANRLQHTFNNKFTVSGGIRKSAASSIKKGLQKAIKSGKLPVAAKAKLEDIIKNGIRGNSYALMAYGSFKFKKDSELNPVEKLEKSLVKFKSLSHDERKAKLEKKRKSSTHKLLGKIAGSIKSRLRKNVLEVYSAIEWAGVHNDGGQAGKGSKIPKRTFLELDDEDLHVLSSLLEGRLEEIVEGA